MVREIKNKKENKFSDSDILEKLHSAIYIIKIQMHITIKEHSGKDHLLIFEKNTIKI